MRPTGRFRASGAGRGGIRAGAGLGGGYGPASGRGVAWRGIIEGHREGHRRVSHFKEGAVMMSPAAVRQVAEEAARYARHNGYRPTVVTEEEKAAALLAWRAGERPSLRIPFIGDYVPKGFVSTDTVLFVDVSGFGERGEGALTTEQFLAAIRPGYAYAILEAGQFQAYIQEYAVVGKGAA